MLRHAFSMIKPQEGSGRGCGYDASGAITGPTAQSAVLTVDQDVAWVELLGVVVIFSGPAGTLSAGLPGRYVLASAPGPRRWAART
jgi:hypothetical protein